MTIIDIPSVLEVLTVALEIERETFLLVIVYYIPGPFGTFIDDFILLINELPIHRILIAVDFNLDQMLAENVVKVDPLVQNFNLSQCSQYSTHIHGGLLDLVFDTSNSKLFLLYCHPTVINLFFFSKSNHYIHIEFSFQQFIFQSSLRNLEILVLLSCLLSLMKGLMKMFGGNNHQSKVTISVFF